MNNHQQRVCHRIVDSVCHPDAQVADATPPWNTFSQTSFMMRIGMFGPESEWNSENRTKGTMISIGVIHRPIETLGFWIVAGCAGACRNRGASWAYRLTAEKEMPVQVELHNCVIFG
jgi:hypothetical protein